MDIGIIGAGNIGGALARRFRAAGHAVAIANSRAPETLAALAAETGAEATTVARAARGRDVVVVTIPLKNVATLPDDLFADVSPNVVVIDTNNYYPQQRDGKIDAIESGTTESRFVAERLGRPVVKAFNTIHSERLQSGGKPAGAPGRIALPIAGDDAAAKTIVSKLIDQIGFDAVDDGRLDESWRQQPGTPVYGADLDVAGTRAALGRASRERTADWRA